MSSFGGVIFTLFAIAIVALVTSVIRCSLASKRMAKRGRIATSQVVTVDDKSAAVVYADQTCGKNEWEFIIDVSQGNSLLYRAKLRDVRPKYYAINGKQTLTELSIGNVSTLSDDRRWIDGTEEQKILLRKAIEKVLQNTYFSIQHNYLLED